MQRPRHYAHIDPFHSNLILVMSNWSNRYIQTDRHKYDTLEDFEGFIRSHTSSSLLEGKSFTRGGERLYNHRSLGRW